LPETVVTKLKFLEGYKFRVEFDLEQIPELLVDEAEPIGGSLGPNPARLLSAAVGHCLSSSLLFCLRKARVEVKNLEATVNADIIRNQEDRLRVGDIDVQLHLEVDEKDKTRTRRCQEIFQNYCTVTESVRKGIHVKVSII
jgi:uncharacterized OsmC-like protein